MITLEYIIIDDDNNDNNKNNNNNKNKNNKNNNNDFCSKLTYCIGSVAAAMSRFALFLAANSSSRICGKMPFLWVDLTNTCPEGERSNESGASLGTSSEFTRVE